MLQHASGSRHIDPDRPPAAVGGLRSQVPDLVLGPRQPLTLASCSKLVEEIRPASLPWGRTMGSEVCIGWAASAVTPGRRSLEWTSSRAGGNGAGRG